MAMEAPLFFRLSLPVPIPFWVKTGSGTGGFQFCWSAAEIFLV